MIRTQIQLTSDQSQALKKVAADEGVSIAEVIRQAVDKQLADLSRRNRRQRALAVLGRFSGGPPDVSVNHDKYLAEDFA